MMRNMVEEYYLNKDYNCAETTLHIINDTYGHNLKEEDFKLVGGFGGGCGCGIVCGALAGAIAGLGKLVITERAHATENFGALCAEYVEEFRKAMTSTECSVVKPVFFKEGVRCLNAVQTAADVFEAFAEKHGLKKGEAAE